MKTRNRSSVIWLSVSKKASALLGTARHCSLPGWHFVHRMGRTPEASPASRRPSCRRSGQKRHVTCEKMSHTQ